MKILKKEDRLSVLASKRIPKAIKAIELVGNLVKYNPTQEQSEKMITVLEESLQSLVARFKNTDTIQQLFEL